MQNRQISIAELPTGTLGSEHFTLSDAPMPEPAEGEVLLRVILMSIDAANRSWMKGATYRAAVNAGDAMPTYAICEVMASNSSRVAVGDLVFPPHVCLWHRWQNRLSWPHVYRQSYGWRNRACLCCRWLCWRICGANRQGHGMPRGGHRRRS